jgi:Uma2 family endonuclease
MTYDRGVLELVTPSLPHEKDALTIARIVDIVAAISGIPILSAGGTTYRRGDLARGFEPDASFSIQHEKHVRDRQGIDLTVDHPPDVVLEMEQSRSAVNKLALFASMGIPEIWRCDGQTVRIYLLEGNAYRPSPVSVAIPALTGEVLTHFLAESRTTLSPDWFQAVSDWARERRTSSP